MQIKFSNKGTTLIAKITGELDHHSADYMREKIDSELIKSSIKNMVFDFSELTFMDSSGIGVILGRYKNIKNLNGKIVISNTNAQIKRLLEMAGILKIIQVENSVEDAIKLIS